MMSCITIFATLLLISSISRIKGDWLSYGYKHEGAAKIVCGPREIYLKDGRYHCYSVSETILNEYERQYGKEARVKLHNQEEYQKLIDTIQNNSFCQKEPNDLLLLLFPEDYEKYVAIGKVLQKLSSVSSYCDYMAITRGGTITVQKLETKIQELLNDRICEKIEKDAAEGSVTKDSKRLQEIGRILKKNEYCGNLKSFGEKVCSKIFSTWLVCAIARFFGAEV